MSSNHDDWVSSVAVLGELVLTGCYDNTVNIWSVSGAKVSCDQSEAFIIIIDQLRAFILTIDQSDAIILTIDQ